MLESGFYVKLFIGFQFLEYCFGFLQIESHMLMYIQRLLTMMTFVLFLAPVVSNTDYHSDNEIASFEEKSTRAVHES